MFKYSSGYSWRQADPIIPFSANFAVRAGARMRSPALNCEHSYNKRHFVGQRSLCKFFENYCIAEKY